MAASTSRLAVRYMWRTPLSPNRQFSTSRSRAADFTHVIIGGGAVGLSIARQLASREGTSTLLIERHGIVGSETSSRNSEVIHAGLYYGHDTLKTNLCLKGKHMMYDLCAKQGIPHRNTKKWIVAQDDQQMGELEKVHKFSIEIGVPTHFLSTKVVKDQEPDLRAEGGVLESSTTGIVDSHSFMAYLEGAFTEMNGEVVFNTTITNIEKTSSGTYLVHSKSADGTENDPIESETLINSAGLGAINLSNLILPKERHRKPFYAKGSYFSYSSSHPKPKTLIYPAPVPGHAGLGTHLTIDLSGRVRFGPDVEWIDDPTDLSPNPARLQEAIEMIKTYLPSIDPDAIDLDYCGIRPKLGKSSGTAGPNFADFYIKEEEGFEGFVNLLGIESPGLTSSLAIGEYVENILYGSKKGQGIEAKEQGKAPKFEFAQ